MKELVTLLQERVRYYETMTRKATKNLEANHVEGRLRVARSHGVYQYYLCTEKGDTKGTYLPKAQQKIAEQIAQRDYDRQVLKCAEQWQRWVKRTIQTMPQIQPADIYNKSQGRKPLITPYEISHQEDAAQWESVPYEGKTFAPDAPEIYTERGERVRSKSEKMIADKLHMLGIPYRYEYPIYLSGFGTVYPDFLQLNRITREEVILEHFGMMDNPYYADKAVRKINRYTQNGFVLGENLLATFETTDTPMDMRVVEKMIKEFMSG